MVIHWKISAMEKIKAEHGKVKWACQVQGARMWLTILNRIVRLAPL